MESAGPERRQATEAVGDRVLRQRHALDAWNAYRQQRERQLTADAFSREDQMFARFEIESMQRTHTEVLDRVARALAGDGEPAPPSTSSAVVAHRSSWVGARIVQALEADGLQVLTCTDNGAEALGVVIAEQPDYVIASDRLAMLSGVQLVTQSAWYSATSQLFVHVENAPEAPFHRAGCVVLGSSCRPEQIAHAVSRP